jgi:hypothetical protein
MRKALVPALLLLLAALIPADADARGNHFRAVLTGFQEVPAISTEGLGLFRGFLRPSTDELEFEFSYDGLEGEILQAHLHLGQSGVNGGIAIFLCSNLGNGPAGTPECPPPPATISGSLSADDVVGPTGQGIQPGEWDEVEPLFRVLSDHLN